LHWKAAASVRPCAEDKQFLAGVATPTEAAPTQVGFTEAASSTSGAAGAVQFATKVGRCKVTASQPGADTRSR